MVVNPVVAITIGVRVCAAVFKNPSDASGRVKSMMTLFRFSAGSRLLVIGTPISSEPATAPASLSIRPLPGLSTAAISSTSAVCRIARTTAPPIRPPTPQTIIPSTIKFLKKAELGHRLCEPLQVSFRHRRERQTQIAAALGHERQRGFNGNWIGLDKQTVNQRNKFELKLASLLPVAF